MSYIVGRGQVAIIDPGPDDEAHVAALLDAVRGETVTHIFVTHTHRDHSPEVPRIKAATGAIVLAEGPHRPARPLNIGEAPRLECQQRSRFPPRPRARRRRSRQRRRLGARGRGDARPHRQSHGLRAQRSEPAVFRRSRDGVVDPGGGAARRRHERLHGLAGKARAPQRADLFPRSRRARSPTRRASLPPTSSTARRARPRSCATSARARATSRRSSARSILGSIRGSPRPPASPCWRISKTW